MAAVVYCKKKKKREKHSSAGGFFFLSAGQFQLRRQWSDSPLRFDLP